MLVDRKSQGIKQWNVPTKSKTIKITPKSITKILSCHLLPTKLALRIGTNLANKHREGKQIMAIKESKQGHTVNLQKIGKCITDHPKLPKAIPAGTALIAAYSAYNIIYLTANERDQCFTPRRTTLAQSPQYQYRVQHQQRTTHTPRCQSVSLTICSIIRGKKMDHDVLNLKNPCACHVSKTPELAQTDREAYSKEMEYLRPVEDRRKKSKRNSMDINATNRSIN